MEEQNSTGFNSLLNGATKITIYDLLKDAHIRSAFAKFSETQVSTSTFLAVALMITFGALIFAARFINFMRSEHTQTEHACAVILAGINFTLISALWTIAYVKFNKLSTKKSSLFRALLWMQPGLQILLPIGATLFFGLQLILRVKGGQCEEGIVYMEALLCNPNQDTNGLPEETLAQLMLLPIVFHIILRDSTIGTFFVAWALSMTSIIVSGLMMNIRQTSPFLVIYFFFSITILYDTQRQNLSLFFLAEKLKYSLAENERRADETHASELRHMIANVAHDLKTPLTSFLSGVEFISQIVVDWDESLSDPSKVPTDKTGVDYVADNLAAIHGCLESIRNTNSFMIMTINRCIDYTKASKGLKLIPKLETIDLQETVDLPIKVMRDFKSHLAINLLPIASDICSHVISDRQWLQENLLCLMSNAVKYSSKGIVEICVTMVTLPIKKEIIVVETKPSSSKKKKISFTKVKVLPAGSASEPSSVHSENVLSLTPSEVSREENSLKMRKLSNFVFNHDYSTMGRSRVFSEKMLADVEGHGSTRGGGGGGGSAGEAYEIVEEGWDGEEEECGEEGLFLRIEVQDTGIGLSEEAMANLFHPFKQAQRLAGGTGLGLFSLAKRIEALNGHYGVGNRRDRQPGSLFWFAIPYRPDQTFAHSVTQSKHPKSLARELSNKTFGHARAGPSNKTGTGPMDALIDLENLPPSLGQLGGKAHSNNSLPSDPSGGPASGRPSSAYSETVSGEHTASSVTKPAGQKLNILLVDDSLSILKMTTMMLKRSGHKVEQADNGAEGLDAIMQGYARITARLGLHTSDCPFDVVLMDLQMPVMDGFESVRRLRAAERDQHATMLADLESNELTRGEDYEKNNIHAVTEFSPGKKLARKAMGLPVEDDSHKSMVSTASASNHLPRKHQFVIGVSANSDHGTMVEAMKAGFDAFIGKPFSIDSFYEVLLSHQNKLKEVPKEYR